MFVCLFLECFPHDWSQYRKNFGLNGKENIHLIQILHRIIEWFGQEEIVQQRLSCLNFPVMDRDNFHQVGFLRGPANLFLNIFSDLPIFQGPNNGMVSRKQVSPVFICFTELLYPHLHCYWTAVLSLTPAVPVDMKFLNFWVQILSHPMF